MGRWMDGWKVELCARGGGVDWVVVGSEGLLAAYLSIVAFF